MARSRTARLTSRGSVVSSRMWATRAPHSAPKAGCERRIACKRSRRPAVSRASFGRSSARSSACGGGPSAAADPWAGPAA
eukprot:15242405-Alexandrium_andersonii.AAC.1